MLKVGEDNKDQKKLLPSINITSSFYEIDLDEDGIKESFTSTNLDGIDAFQIYNKNQSKIFESKFQTKGPKSRLYRMELRRLSSVTKVMILYYFEGVTNYLTLKNPGYLYFVTIDRNDLSTLKMSKGPMFWLEHKDIDDTYSQRKFDVDIYDFNKDGVKEVRAKYHQISSVFMYQGQGVWQGI